MEVLENRVIHFLNNSCIKKCPWGRERTLERNNTSNQGAIHQRELTFETLCKMFPCFCLPLFTTGLMKKKDDKYVYTKSNPSIIHHPVGLQYNYFKRRVFYNTPTVPRHLRLNCGSDYCLPVHVFRNCPWYAVWASDLRQRFLLD